MERYNGYTRRAYFELGRNSDPKLVDDVASEVSSAWRVYEARSTPYALLIGGVSGIWKVNGYLRSFE